MEKGAILIRLAVFLGFLALVVLVQRFWFLGAWHRIQTVNKPAIRQALQGIWVAALVLFLATFLDPFVGGFIPRRGVGLWLISASRLWLFASFFGFLAIEFVNGVAEIAEEDDHHPEIDIRSQPEGPDAGHRLLSPVTVAGASAQ